MSKEQAAAKDQSEAKPSEQSEGEQDDDLDTLLRQYDEESNQEQVSQPKLKQEGSDDKLNMIVNYLQQQEQKNQQREVDDAIKASVKSMKEYLGAENVEDDYIRALIEGSASTMPQIRTAFIKRKEKPADWDKVMRGLAKKYQKYVPKGDDDREAVVAAVKGSSSSKPEPEKDFPSDKEFKSMSDREFQEWVRKNVK